MWVEFNTIKDPIIDTEAVREVIITVRMDPINKEIIRNIKTAAINSFASPWAGALHLNMEM